MDKRTIEIAQNALDGRAIARADAEYLAALSGQRVYDLFYWANAVRHAFHGEVVSPCCVISAKQGLCAEDCKFCAQSAHHKTSIAEYPLLAVEEILHAAERAKEIGSKGFGIVTSGVSACEGEDWPQILEAVRCVGRLGGIRPCASLGVLTEEAARELKEAGLVRFHHNLETSESHFSKICSTHTFADRLRTLRVARAAGLEVCSGGIFGVGETWKDRVDLAFTLRDLRVDSVPLNFLNPIPGTPMEGAAPLPPMELLKIISLYRLILPRQEIRVCGGREVNLRDLQSWVFYAGANGVMIGNYLTTQGRPPDEDWQMVKDLGFSP